MADNWNKAGFFSGITEDYSNYHWYKGEKENPYKAVNPALRKAAEDAAKKARFNAVSGLNNQTGTITYYFNLK